MKIVVIWVKDTVDGMFGLWAGMEVTGLHCNIVVRI